MYVKLPSTTTATSKRHQRSMCTFEKKKGLNVDDVFLTTSKKEQARAAESFLF